MRVLQERLDLALHELKAELMREQVCCADVLKRDGVVSGIHNDGIAMRIFARRCQQRVHFCKDYVIDLDSICSWLEV